MTQSHPGDNTELFQGEMPEKHAMLPGDNHPKGFCKMTPSVTLGQFDIASRTLLLVDPKTCPIYFEPRSLNPKV
jgi:hypothetical protein